MGWKGKGRTWHVRLWRSFKCPLTAGAVLCCGVMWYRGVGMGQTCISGGRPGSRGHGIADGDVAHPPVLCYAVMCCAVAHAPRLARSMADPAAAETETEAVESKFKKVDAKIKKVEAKIEKTQAEIGAVLRSRVRS